MTTTLGRPTLDTEPESAPAEPHRPGPGWRRLVPATVAAVLWIVALAAALTAAAGVITDAVRPGTGAPLIPVPPNLGYAAFVAVLAAATARRKRIAHRVLMVYFAVTLVTGAVLLAVPRDWLTDAGIDGADRLVAGIGAGVAVPALLVLLAARHEFQARVRRGGARRAMVVFVALAVVFVAAGYGLATAFPGTLGGLAERLVYAAERVLGGALVDPGRDGRAPGWVDLLLGLLGALAVLAALWALLRGQRAAAVLHPDDEGRIRTLLSRYGDRDPLGYFATRRDRAATFSPTGRSAVAYRVVKRTALAGGDPIGEPAAWGAAIEAWLAEVRRHGWTPAVVGASEEGAAAYAKAGLEVVPAGDEATLLSREFTLDGPRMRPVRQPVERLERAGYTTSVRRHDDVPDEEMRVVGVLAARWGGSAGLGRLGDPADGRCVLVEALDCDGSRRALLSLVPWGTRGLCVDLVCRDPEAADGVVDLMVAALVHEAPRLGVDRVSLGLALDRNAFGATRAGAAWPDSAYRASARYQPQWTQRYACVEARRDLARVGRVVAMPPPPVTLVNGPGTAIVTAPPASGEQADGRFARRERLLAEGIDPYPAGFPRTDNIVAIGIRHEGLAPDTRTGDLVAVAGRVVLMRDHGGVCFATVRDWTGDLQVMLDGGLDDWRSTVDLGDHVGVRGEVVTTKHGELSVRAESWRLTAKCLRPLPDKHRGLAGQENRARRRCLDLVTSAEARDLLRARSAVVQSLRDTLLDRGYLEVETPILHGVPGANGRSFTTHLNAYDMRLSLRLGPEPYLRRLAAGGVERVFELGRAFRNEGVDVRHNPEFTMLAAHQAYADQHTMRQLAQALVQRAALAAYGSTVAYQPSGTGPLAEHDLSGDWPVVPLHRALSEALGESVTLDTGPHTLCRMCDSAGLAYDPRLERGALLMAMYQRLVVARSTTPVFYTDFPIEVAPLARAHPADARLAERWDLVGFGSRLGAGRSELTDPVEQRRRLTLAGEPDPDMLQAMEYAMPPTGALGLGADRVVMLLTGHSIREIIPFPLVR